MRKVSWALLLCALSCSKKDEKGAGDGGAAATQTGGSLPTLQPLAPPAPKHADTTPLWAFAPADATAGLVVGDGVIVRAIEAANSLVKDLEGKPWAQPILEEYKRARQEAPFDFLDPKAWPSVGADAGKGFAIFFGPKTNEPIILVAPIVDRAALRKKVNGTIEKAGDREVDAMGPKGRCTEANGRYVCAENTEVLLASLQPHDPVLAGAVKALPAEARGDIEFYGDIAKTPWMQQSLVTSPLAKTATGGMSIRLQADGATVRLWGKGDYAELAQKYGSAPPPAELSGMTAAAQTVIRWKFDPSLLTAQLPATIPAEVRTELLEQLTGDVQVVTAGKGLVGGAVLAKVKDAARARKAIASTCAELKGAQGIANPKVDDNGCSGDLDLRKEAPDLPPIRLGITVAGDLVMVTMGDVEPGTLKGSVVAEVASPEAKDILGGAQTFAIWSRSLDVDISRLPKQFADGLLGNPQAMQAISVANWFASQVAEVAFGANVTATGAQAVLRVVTYAADPPEARTAYLAALDKRAAGDNSGYAFALTEIETKHATSLVARRAKLERTGRAVVGPPTALVAAGLVAYMFNKAATPSLPLPDLGGGFGEPNKR